MDDALLVRRFQSVRNLFRDRQRLANGDRPVREALRQILPFDEFHHEGVDVTGLFESVNDRDVGMIQRGQRLGFPLEARGPVGVMGEGFGQDLDRHISVQLRVPRTVHLSQPVPRFREANAAATSSPPLPDDGRPGLILFPRRVDWMTTFGLKSVIYHKGVPGHFFASGLQVENKDLPAFRQLRFLGNVPAFGEGSGLYAERLAAESGWYSEDPEGLLGQLNWELFRARRLVVDTGLHAKHWTRQQAIDYGIEPSEVERYVVYPGQARAYMIGEMKILDVREKAKASLGERFSLQQFHNVVLETSTVPLGILDNRIGDWVRSQGGKW